MDYNYTRIMNPQKKKQKQRGIIMYKYFLITIMSITMAATPVYACDLISKLQGYCSDD